MFCKSCGTLLVPKITPYGKWMACPNGHTQPKIIQETETSTEKNLKIAKRIQVADGKNILAVHDHLCPKCSYDKAELIEMSASYSDARNEENTSFLHRNQIVV